MDLLLRMTMYPTSHFMKKLRTLYQEHDAFNMEKHSHYTKVVFPNHKPMYLSKDPLVCSYMKPPKKAECLSTLFESVYGPEKPILDMDWVKECLLKKQVPEPIVNTHTRSVIVQKVSVCKPYPTYLKNKLPVWKR